MTMVKCGKHTHHLPLTTLYTRTHTHTTRKKNHTDLGSTHRLVQMFLDDRWRGMGKTIYICCSVMYFTVHALHRKERRNERKKDGRTVEHEDSEYNNLYYRNIVFVFVSPSKMFVTTIISGQFRGETIIILWNTWR